MQFLEKSPDALGIAAKIVAPITRRGTDIYFCFSVLTSDTHHNIIRKSQDRCPVNRLYFSNPFSFGWAILTQNRPFAFLHHHANRIQRLHPRIFDNQRFDIRI